MRKALLFILSTFLVFSFSEIVSAQQQKKKPNPAKRSKKLNSPTINGSSGLFEVFSADNLRQGEFNIGLNYHRYTRDPGALRIEGAPVTGALGVHDRIELFTSFDLQKRVHAKDILYYKNQSGVPFRPTQNRRGETMYATVAPFIDVPFGSGLGDVLFGGKAVLISERFGNPFGMALRGWAKIPTATTGNQLGLSKGRGSGQVSAGYEAIVSKFAGPVGFNANFGHAFHRDPTIDGATTLLHNEFRYAGGLNFPATSRIQGIFEVNGTKFIGNTVNIINQRVNPVDTVDLTWGMRFYPANWISFGGGYKLNAHRLVNELAVGSMKTERHGFVAQLAFHKRKNEPPTAVCNADGPTTIFKGGTIRVHVEADDPEDDPITINWKASNGKIEGSGETITWTAPRKSGSYTVTAEVADDSRAMASCSVQITVKNRPPVVRTEPESITITKGESTTIKAIASDPDDDPLTYEWSVNDEKVAGATGTEFVFDSKDRSSGTYKVSVTVSDGEDTASASSTVIVIVPPPKARCAAQPTELNVGNRARLAVSVENGEPPFTYEWTVTPGGRVEGTGAEVTFDTTGLSPGDYTATVKVTDSKGRSDSCSVTLKVLRREPEKVVCDGLKSGRARARNDCKAALDRVAEALKADPNLSITITGYTDSKEGKSLGLSRAQSAATFLTKERRIAKNRIKVVNGGSKDPVDSNKTAQGRAKNRRIEVVFTAK